MALLDFTEIPPAHAPSPCLEAFEIFAGGFLELCGFSVIEGPSRGQDGGKDLIVERVKVVDGEKERNRYIVSCKHKAHSGKSVGVDDETDIPGRVAEHDVDGFIGFYSTELSSALRKRLKGVDRKYGKVDWYTPQRIDQIVSERFIEFRGLLLRNTPRSLAVYEDARYVNRPTISKFEHLVRDFPDLQIRSVLTKDGEVFHPTLSPTSKEWGSTMFSLSDHTPPEIIRAIQSNQRVIVPNQYIEFNDASSIGAYLRLVNEPDGYMEVLPVDQTFDLVMNVIVRSNDRSIGPVTFVNQRFRMTIFPDERVQISSVEDRTSDSFRIDWESIPQGSQRRGRIRIRTTIENQPVPIVEQVLMAATAMSRGATVTLRDLQERNRQIRFTVESGKVNPPSSAILSSIEKLKIVESAFDVSFLFPEGGLSGSDEFFARILSDLVHTGRARAEGREIRFDVPVNDPHYYVHDSLPETTQALWRHREPEVITLLGEEIPVDGVFRIREGWKIEREDDTTDEGGGRTVRLVPDTSNEYEIVVPKFLSDEKLREEYGKIPSGSLIVGARR